MRRALLQSGTGSLCVSPNVSGTVHKEGNGTPGLYVRVSFLRKTFFVKRFSASPTNFAANLLARFREYFDSRDAPAILEEAPPLSNVRHGSHLHRRPGDVPTIVPAMMPSFTDTQLGDRPRFRNACFLRNLASAYGDRMKYVSGRAKEQLGVSALLIRPDGIIAWASDSNADCSELHKAAARWFVFNSGIQAGERHTWH